MHLPGTFFFGYASGPAQWALEFRRADAARHQDRPGLVDPRKSHRMVDSTPISDWAPFENVFNLRPQSRANMLRPLLG